MAISYRMHGITDRGRSREINEDSIGYRRLTDGVVAVVADGVGGHPGGAYASRLSVDEILRLAEHEHLPMPADRLVRICTEANAAVRRAQREHPGYEEMATTVVALLTQERQAAVLHAGDSRCYLWRDRSLSLLTRDHTVAEQMVEDGTISPEDVGRTPYQHVLTRGLGLNDEFGHAVTPCAPKPGDLYLLCSDGLSKPLPDAELAATLAEHEDEVSAAEALVEAANAAGGPDNVSVILVRCVETQT